MRVFLSDERGSTLPLFALVLAIAAVLLGAVTNNGLNYLQDRRMQGLADLVALLAVRDENYSREFALRIIADQRLDATVYEPVLEPGHYIPDPELAPRERFTPGRRPFNAVRVRLHAASSPDGEPLPPSHLPLLAEAAAARRDMVSFAIGSRLARVEGGLGGEALAALIGRNGSISVMDYEALAGIRVDGPAFLGALAREGGIRAVTYDELLAARVPVSAIPAALESALPEQERAMLLRLMDADRIGSRSIRVDSLLSAGGYRGQPVLNDTAGVQLSVLDLIEAAALLGTGDRQIDLGTASGRGAVTLALSVGEHPVSPPLGLVSERGDRAETRQLSLHLRTAARLGDQAIGLQLATAEAELVRLTCGPGRQVRADFDVRTSPARLDVPGRLLTPAIHVDLGAPRTERVSLTNHHIRTGEPETVRSGLGSQTQIAGLGLDPLLGNFLTDLDAWLEAAGLTISEADLFLRDVRCGTPFLIE